MLKGDIRLKLDIIATQSTFTCLKLAIETLEQVWNISYLVLVFLLLILSKLVPTGNDKKDELYINKDNVSMIEANICNSKNK